MNGHSGNAVAVPYYYYVLLRLSSVDESDSFEHQYYYPADMDDLENRTTEELQKELEQLEESYIRNFASKFDKEALNEIWERMKKVKEELKSRKGDD